MNRGVDAKQPVDGHQHIKRYEAGDRYHRTLYKNNAAKAAVTIYFLAMPRLFTALDLPEDVRLDIADTYYAMLGARWVPVDNLHITLRFIGEVNEPAVADITHALELVEHAPFTFSLSGVGYFPPRKKPNLLWVGIAPNESLQRLRTRVDRAITNAGFSHEGRKFHPHITVARLSDESPLTRIGQFLSSNSLFKSTGIAVSQFHLYTSTPTAEGTCYQKIASYDLSGNSVFIS